MNRPLELSDLSAIGAPSAIAVSPDGDCIAYTLSGVEGDKNTSSLWIVAAAGGAPRRLTSDGHDTAPAWNGSGTRLAFLRSTGSGPAQLWIVSPDGGEPHALTSAEDFPLGAGAPVWGRGSDADTKLFVSAPVSIVAAAPATEDHVAPEPIVADRIDYKADGTGYAGNVRTHLFELTLPQGSAVAGTRQITDGDWNAGAAAVSADGRRLAFAAARDADRDITQTTHVWAVDLADATLEPVRIGQAAAVAGPLLWSTDGQSVLAIGMKGMNIGNAGLWRLHVDASRSDENLTSAMDRNVMPGGIGYPGGRPQLTDIGEILFCLRMGGNTHVYKIATDGTISGVLTGEHHVVAGLSHAAGTTAAILATQESFGEVVVVQDNGQPTPLTSITATALPEVELIKPQPRSFTISDGVEVAGWLIRDESLQDGPAPLLLDIHGGPHNAWTGVADAMHPYHQELAAKGWTILLLNPRGSDGYGEEFMRATIDAWGTADRADWMEPIDELIAEGLADPARLAVTGYSYGGFGTCVLTGTTDRFAAAVAGGLVCNLRQLPGASDEGVFLSRTELSGGDEHASQLSPLNFVDKVTTPTLVLHGERDSRCPVNQAEQWFGALRLNGVPTRLVLYPQQSHAFILDGPLSHRIDYSVRLIEWLELHTPAATEAKAAPAGALDGAYWQHRLETLIAKYQVPGAVLGILRTDQAPSGRGLEEAVVAAAGITNIHTGHHVVADTIFQLGSIGKTWTATLVMQLVAEGLLDLDAPIRKVLPDFKLADESAAATITMRHLLTHTSGIDGDIHTDTGRGDDCVEKYVALLHSAEQVFAPGETWSYCNTGLVIAGRIVEVLRGMSWDAALAEYIYAPLALEKTTTLPEVTALHSYAVGHLGLGEDQAPTPAFLIPRSSGPAGLISASAADTLTYARTFLPGGTPLMPQEQLAQMLAPQVDMSAASSIADAWGLGWCLQDWGGVPTLNHNGMTLGQLSYLRLFPEQGIALFLSLNGGLAEALHRELFGEAAQALAGATIPAVLEPATDPNGGAELAVLEEYAGHYEAAGLRVTIGQVDGTWAAMATSTSELEGRDKSPVPMALVAVGGQYFGAKPDDAPFWTRISFETSGSTTLMHFGTRAYPKVASHG